MFTTKALVRRPSPRLAEAITRGSGGPPVDLDLALRQWEDYVEAMHGAGWETIEVEPADDCPDSVFVEDTVVVYGDLAVIARPGADSRRPEITAVRKAVGDLGYRIGAIEPPGTLDGGDVLKFDDTVWVGVGGRTNADGADQLRRHLAPFGAEVIDVPLNKVLHLKSAVTALPDRAVIGYEPLVDDPNVWPTFEAVPEEAGSHVVILGPDTLLMATSAPRTIELMRRRGYEVLGTDICEYEKLDGCVTCLSVRLRGI